MESKIQVGDLVSIPEWLDPGLHPGWIGLCGLSGLIIEAAPELTWQGKAFPAWVVMWESGNFTSGTPSSILQVDSRKEKP